MSEEKRNGPARCKWIISVNSFPFQECGCLATRFDPKSGATFCEDHSEDYVDVFGEAALRSIPETPSAGNETQRRLCATNGFPPASHIRAS